MEKVVAGNVRGAGRLEFSVTGDALNVGAGAESVTRQTGDTILVAQRTADPLRELPVRLDKRANLTAKGKTALEALYAARQENGPVPTRRSEAALEP